MKADILVKNALIVTVDEKNTVIRDGCIAIYGGKIIAIGDSSIEINFKAEKIIDANGFIVMPGLINSHTHASMTMFRGMADDMPLHDWLNNYIFPAEAKFLAAQNVKLGAQLACHEMISSGTTCFADMYYFEDEVAQACKQAGMRCLLSEALIDFPVPNNPTPQHALDNTIMLVEKYKGDSLVNIAVGPHSPYTCSPQWLVKGKELAIKLGIPYHIHLAETRWELDQCMTTNGCSPTANLHKLGLLDPGTIAAHSIYLDDADIELLHETGASAVNNPQSNMKLASGVAPVPKMLAAGCNVALGTDGVVSNNSLDMFTEMKVAALVHKLNSNDPSVLNATSVVRMATINGAKALGLSSITGSIEVGKRADIILVDIKQAHALPLYNVWSQIVYSLSGHDVDTVIIDGKIVMENKVLSTIDLQGISQEMTDLSRTIARELKL